MTDKNNGFETWGIVQLMGHSKIAGKISEQTIAGSDFLRVDVPDTDLEKGYTRFFGSGSIYSIDPMTEETTMMWIQNNRFTPAIQYDVMADYEHRMLNEAKEIDGEEDE